MSSFFLVNYKVDWGFTHLFVKVQALGLINNTLCTHFKTRF